MAKKTASTKKIVNKFSAVTKETKADVRNIKRTVNAFTKLFRDASGRFQKAPPPKPSPKKSAKKVTSKKTNKTNDPFADGRSYTIRKAPFSTGTNYAQWVNSIESNSDKYDSLLKPGEFFIATVYGNRTKIPYQSISLLLPKLNEYVEKSNAKDRKRLISNIKIMKFKGGASEDTSARKYARERKKVLAKREGEKSVIHKEAVKAFGATDKTTKKRKATVDLLGDAMRVNKELQARLEAMERQLAKLSKPAKKVAKKVAKKAVKKAAKKAVKKSASKKTVAKKSAPKKTSAKNSKRNVSSPTKTKVNAKKAPKKVAKSKAHGKAKSVKKGKKK